MYLGEQVTVARGPFAGARGTIVGIHDDSIGLSISIAGQPCDITVDPIDLASDPRAEIAHAVRGRRAQGWQLRRFWITELLRGEPRELATLAEAYAAHAAPIERDCDAQIAAELARWEATVVGLDADARDAKWEAEREQWTAWQDQGKSAQESIFAELLSDTPADERESRAHELAMRSRELEQRVAVHRAHTALARPIVEEARDEQLEQQIELDIDRDDAFLVYADWLQSQGNRRGEWIALSAAGEPAEELRTALAPQLLGPLVELEPRFAASWRLGYLDAITLETTRDDEAAGLNIVELVRAALALPTCRFLRELTIGLPSLHEDGSVLEALLAAGRRPALRWLALVTNQEEEMLSWTSAGDLAPLAELYPNLESLVIEAGSYQLAAPEFPHLKRLVLETCGPPPGIALAIARAAWPHLEELELWFGSSSYGVELSIDELAHRRAVRARGRLAAAVAARAAVARERYDERGGRRDSGPQHGPLAPPRRARRRRELPR